MNLFFYNYSNYQKPLALLVVFVFLANIVFAFALLPVQQVKAQVWTNDIFLNPLQALWKQIDTALQRITSWASNVSALRDIWDQAHRLLKEGTLWAVQQVLYKMLGSVSNDLLRDLTGGEGVKFVQNWYEYLNLGGLEGTQRFFDVTMQGANLCENFKSQVTQAARPITYSQISACSTEGTGNIWEAFLAILPPSQNYLGSVQLAVDEKIRQETAARQDAQLKAVTSDGYLPKETDVGTGETGGTWKVIETPGSLIGHENKQVVDSGRALLEKEIAAITPHLEIFGIQMTPILTSLFTSLLNRLIQQGLSMLSGIGENSADDSYYYDQATQPGGSGSISVPIDRYTDPYSVVGGVTDDQVQDDLAATELLTRTLGLLQEDLETDLLYEAQREVSAVNQIRSAQQAVLEGLLEIAKLQDQGYTGAGFPSWASQSVVSTSPAATTYRISASGIGTITYERTTSALGETYTVISIDVATAPSHAVENVMPRIDNTAAAISAVQSYETTAQDFLDFYNRLTFPLGAGQAAELMERETTLIQERDQTIQAVQAATNGSSDDFGDLLTDAREETIRVVEEAAHIRDDIIPALENQMDNIQNRQAEVQDILANAEPPAIDTCIDGIDNDGDGLVDANDPGCAFGTDESSL